MIRSIMDFSVTARAIDTTTDAAAQHASGESFAEALSTASGKDTVTLSGGSGLLSSATLLLPTVENARMLLAGATEELGKLFRGAGIESQPPVEFQINSYTGGIEVTGNRADADRIEELIAANPDVEMQVHNALAVSSHAYAMPEQLRFQAEYRASSDPEAVVAKYSHLFGQRETHDYSLRFGVGGSEIVVDGETWIGVEA